MDFGSLNIDNLENIISSLSQSDIEQLSDLAQSFMSADGGKNEGHTKSREPQSDNGFDPQLLSRIMQIMTRLSKQKDSPACELLRALRPMLSPERQKKTDEAIDMLRILTLLPVINELKG